MSRFHREWVLCPQCANEDEVVLWDLVSISEDPDLRERLLAKDLQRLTCSNCEEEAILAEPFVYLDEERAQLFYYCPQFKDLLESGVMPDEAQASLQASLAELLGEGQLLSTYQCRLFPQYNALIESLLLEEKGFDDRLMAIVKLALKTRYATEERLYFEEFYFLDATEEQLYFQVFEAEKGWNHLEIKRELYEHAQQHLGERLKQEPTQWLCVDEHWARRYVEG